MKISFTVATTALFAQSGFLALAPRRKNRHMAWSLLLYAFVCIIAGAAVPSARAQQLTTLYSFCAQTGCPDGNYPSGLVQGTDGNFYGTTSGGGSSHWGTVFKITPGGTFTTLYSFCSPDVCTDGSGPAGSLMVGTDGYLYGTTSRGGDYDSGTVYRISTDGTFLTLHSFCSQYNEQNNCADGEGPSGALVQSDGLLYGITVQGGTSDNGTIFAIAPAGGPVATLYSFCSQSNCADGKEPVVGLTQSTDGFFYGTTPSGGTAVFPYNPGGTVFKISSSGFFTTLYTFGSQGYTNGYLPYAGLVQGADGDFYGTTAGGGGSGSVGTIFKITSNGTLTTLYDFCLQIGCQDGHNGQFPHAGLVQGTDGNFYGTTSYAGAESSSGGTVFSITPSGSLTTLYSFCCADGAQPYAGLVQGTDGNFYGTTTAAGAYGYGTIFKLSVNSPPSVSLSPASLTFSDQVINTSSTTLAVTLSNNGPTTLTISSISIAGTNPGDFSQGNTCGGSVAAGGSCTITVTFTPSATGSRTASLNITDNADNNPQTVPLAGTGTASIPVAGVSPSSLTFGNQNVGTTSQPQPVTLSNTGTGPLTLSSFGFTGDFAETNNCGVSVAAGSSCTINVTFTPNDTGTRTGVMSVVDNSNGVTGSQQFVSLSGNGTTANNAGATISPTSLVFANQVINTSSASKKITLTSSGTTPLSFSGISFTGANALDFFQTNNCPAILNVGSSCTINVIFTPGVVGPQNAVLNVNDNATNNPQTSALSGTGIAPVTLTPVSFNFGNVGLNSASAAKSFTLKNNQSIALNISSIGFTGANAVDFSQTGTCGGTLAAKSSCTISVTFTASTLALESATLVVTEDAPVPYNTVSSSMSGTGAADVTLTPASASFGNVAIDTTSGAKNFTLKNNQLATLNFSVSFVGSNLSDFSNSPCGTSLAGKSSCTISVTFTPTILGAESATLMLTDDAPPPYNTLTSSLTGTGIAQVTLTPAVVTFAAQQVGTTSAAHKTTLHNNLDIALPFTTTFTDADPSDFAATDTCSESVPAKSTCTVSVTFTPSATGTRTATLNINDSGNNNPQTTLLTGTGK